MNKWLLQLMNTALLPLLHHIAQFFSIVFHFAGHKMLVKPSDSRKNASLARVRTIIRAFGFSICRIGREVRRSDQNRSCPGAPDASYHSKVLT